MDFASNWVEKNLDFIFALNHFVLESMCKRSKFSEIPTSTGWKLTPVEAIFYPSGYKVQICCELTKSYHMPSKAPPVSGTYWNIWEECPSTIVAISSYVWWTRGEVWQFSCFDTSTYGLDNEVLKPNHSWSARLYIKTNCI